VNEEEDEDEDEDKDEIIGARTRKAAVM